MKTYDEFEYKDIIKDLEDDINDLDEKNRRLLNIIKKQEKEIRILIKIINLNNDKNITYNLII